MSKITRNYRSVAFFALAALLGVGAFTSLYAPPPKKYTSAAICYYGSYPITYSNYISQASVDQIAQDKVNENPTLNRFGPCPVGQEPSTPGVP